MDIVDSQVHIGPGGVAETVAAMDALGIAAVLIHESWMGRFGEPGYRVGEGALRAVSPTAELAAWSHPGRFAYVVCLDRRDPELAAVIRMARDATHARALRILVGVNRAETAAFAAGAYEPLFAAAADAGLPIFTAISGQTDLLAPYLRKFPSVKVIVDHCGMPPSRAIRGVIAQMEGLPDSADYWTNYGAGPQEAHLDKVLRLADHPNVALKWAHASAMFEAPGFANPAVRPHLRRALDAFGAERVMWASDYTALPTGETWAEVLFGMRVDPGLSDRERALLLGGTVRAWLDWA